MRRFGLPLGPLLSWLGATVFCCGSAPLADAGQQQKPPPAHGPGLKQTALISGKQQATPTPPPPKEGMLLKIGDVTIANASTMLGLVGSKDGHIKGPKTEITIPDKESKSVLVVHADDIVGVTAGKGNLNLITLTGNVRYRLVQQSPEGERILEGTAGHAVVRRLEKRIDFTGGTHLKLTDPARFKGPATLRTSTLNVAMNGKSYRYNLEGPAANNDIQFTPLQAPPTPKAGAKPGAPTPVGAVHIFGFRSGDLQFGQSIHLHGAGTTCDFASPDEKTSWHLQGEQFEGEFVAETSNLQRATVTDSVKFNTKQPSSDKKTTTSVDGTASQASYVRSEAGQEMIAHGPLNINLIDPEHLEGPTPISTGPKGTLTLKKAGDTLSYVLDDPDGTLKGNFTPKEVPEEKAKPAKPPITK